MLHLSHREYIVEVFINDHVGQMSYEMLNTTAAFSVFGTKEKKYVNDVVTRKCIEFSPRSKVRA